METILCPIGSKTVTKLSSYGIRQPNDETTNDANEPNEPNEPNESNEPNEPANVSSYEPDADESSDESDANEPADANAIQLLYATIYDATTTNDANDATATVPHDGSKTTLFVFWLTVS